MVDTAAANGNFATLTTALATAGLTETLAGAGPFTVFAPVDDAFAALPEGTLETLLADAEGALTDLLSLHVVQGRITAADLSDGSVTGLVTINGTNLAVTLADDGSVLINGAKVIIPDVETSNGIIHVLDAVLMPGADDGTDGGADAEQDAAQDDTSQSDATDAPATEAATDADAPAADATDAAAAGADAPSSDAGADSEGAAAAVDACGRYLSPPRRSSAGYGHASSAQPTLRATEHGCSTARVLRR
ncbi:MAG: fasciclin domain-containing protein [Caldilineaceae bacterium]|nr:fasciclin domain-containing protein [Caldilineaceae bacterium]